MKGQLLKSAFLSVSLLFMGCGQEASGMDYSEFYREIDTKELHLSTEPLLVQEDEVAVSDGLLTVRLERESYKTDYFVIRINREWEIYADCKLTATWVTALGEDAESYMTGFGFLAGNTEYLMEVPRSTYRYIRFEIDAQPARVLANAIHSSAGLGDVYCFDGVSLRAVPVARSVVGISGLQGENKVYVDFMRDGVVVDCGWAGKDGDYPTKYDVDGVCYFVIEGGDGFADGGW